MTETCTLDGKAAIVTGATTEPGRTIVAALAAAGATVAAVDDDQPVLQALAVEVAGGGAPGRVLAMAAELWQPGMGRRVVSRASLAFGEINGLVIAADGLDAAAPPQRDGDLPFWDSATAPPDPGAPVDIALSLAAPAARQFRARGWGRLVVVAGTTVEPALARRVAGWAHDLADTGVTANLLAAGAAPQDAIAAVIRWLMSEASDGVNGQLLTADTWDVALPESDAARQAARPIV